MALDAASWKVGLQGDIIVATQLGAWAKLAFGARSELESDLGRYKGRHLCQLGHVEHRPPSPAFHLLPHGHL